MSTSDLPEEKPISGTEQSAPARPRSWPKPKGEGFDAWFQGSVVVDENGSPEVFFHGSSSLETLAAFDPAYTGKGNDQMGSGFYFTNHPSEASLYAWQDTHIDGAGERYPRSGCSSGVVPVYLSVKNPILVSGVESPGLDVDVTLEQAFQIIKRAPNVFDLDESPIGNWIDVWGEGEITEAMIRKVAASYQGQTLVSLEGDFYRGAATEFRHAVHDVMGFDGVLRRSPDGHKHVVAWFPGQVKSALSNQGAYDRSNPDIRMSLPSPKRGAGGLKRWFQGSKIVQDGTPIVLYHGARPGVDIDEFRLPNDRDGIYFTPDPEYAEGFTFNLHDVNDDSAGAIYPVYLSIKNPYVVHAKDDSPEFWNFVYRGLDRRELQAQGYDGAALYVEGFGLDQVIAFDPKQIRSAIGRRLEQSGERDLFAEVRLSVPSEAGQGVALTPTLGAGQLRREALYRALQATKVVSRRGRPMVVFHRTAADIAVFDPDRGDLGTHFGSAEQAQSLNGGLMRDGENTMPVYLDIRNPIRLKDLGSFHADAVAPQLKRKEIIDANTALRLYEMGSRGTVLQRREANREIKRILAEAGFDGVVYANRKEGRGDSWIAFRPEQIKSAIGNRGTFDLSSPDIRESLPARAQFYRLSDLPRDMREELFNEHAMNLDPEATEARFYARKVPCGMVDVDDLVVGEIPIDQMQRYLELPVHLLPPVVVADGRLIDGQHRVVAARLQGAKQLRYIDMTGLIDTSVGGYISQIQPDRSAFRRWFEGSKVAAADGSPVVLYHGTTSDIVAFQPNRPTSKDAGWYGMGIYFTADPNTASAYSGYEALQGKEPSGPARVMPVYASLKNPYYWPEGRRPATSPEESQAIRAELEGAGYDGVIVSNPHAEDRYSSFYEVVAFRPAQIKSAIGNRGTFDPQNDDIRMSQPKRIRPGETRDVRDLPTFRAWFGESKVVDEQGRPLVVYHGTGNGQLDFMKNAWAFFTSSPVVADTYTKGRVFVGRNESGKAIYPVYVSLQNPLIVDAKGQGWESVPFDPQDGLGQYHTSTDDLAQYARRNGYDGLIVRNVIDPGPGARSFPKTAARVAAMTGDTVVAFRPEQIKSATGNRGSFDSSSPDIRFSTPKSVAESPFRTWFGESKVVDEQGQPLVVYHGSGSPNIVAFRKFRDSDGAGWFARDPALASHFASAGGGGRGDTVYPVYLSIQNPLDARGGLPEDVRQALLLSDRSTSEVLSEMGYDGLIGDESGGKMGEAGTTYLAFRPEQIKSAIGNRGTFDAQSSDIRMSSPRSARSKESRDVRDLPAFRAWFGASKVVDSKGLPVVVYHGSPDLRFVSETGRFLSQRERIGAGQADQAHWFASSAAVARTYANPRRAFDYQAAEEGVFDAFLRMENPMEIDAQGANWRDAQRRGKTSEVIALARSLGHDGVIIRNVKDEYNNGPGTKPTDTFVVFDSTQIKAASMNRGSFDLQNPDVRMSIPVQRLPSWEAEMRAACEDLEAGFHFEEGGCWGMALALHDELGGQIMVSTGSFSHACIRMAGGLMDWQGSMLSSDGYRPVSVQELRALASEAGFSRDEVDADRAFARSVIGRAMERSEGAEFAQWFSGSKVCDPSGRPLIQYHGTVSDFEIFGRTKDVGYHFGTKEQANDIFGRGRNGRQIIPVYLSIKAPLRLIEDPRTWNPDYLIGKCLPEGVLDPVVRKGLLELNEQALAAAREEARQLRDEAGRSFISDEDWLATLERHTRPLYAAIVSALEDAGFDGIVYENRYEGPRRARADSWVAFRPEQIRFALRYRHAAKYVDGQREELDQQRRGREVCSA